MGFLVTINNPIGRTRIFKQEEMNEVWDVVLKLPKNTVK